MYIFLRYKLGIVTPLALPASTAEHPLCVVEMHHQPKRISPLLSKQTSHPLQHAILLWVIRMVFARNLEDCGEGIGEVIDVIANTLCDLVDE